MVPLGNNPRALTCIASVVVFTALVFFVTGAIRLVDFGACVILAGNCAKYRDPVAPPGG